MRLLVAAAFGVSLGVLVLGHVRDLVVPRRWREPIAEPLTTGGS